MGMTNLNSKVQSNYYAPLNNFLLTESAVITEKYQTGVLTVRTEPVGRARSVHDRQPKSDIFS